MISQRLQDFLLTWCNPETQPDEVATMLGGRSGAYYQGWLESEMLAAARAGDLTPKSLARLTGLGFDDQREVDDWLQAIWPMWFSGPYPG
jgi:hypothetical protein